ncbi:MAG: type II toxin-antitoxin system HicA family toxin [Chloroflexi bacterium]|nr:type II toxin-antitoxin system HicA family toxin [Chloroflexota bacterium]MBI3740919.1 type II toxin-antitoxin system HicA family toxin [Chloroflexota bacterium]
MSKISPLKSDEVIRRLRKLGFEGPIAGGKHMRMIHPNKRQIVPIPTHKGKDVGVGLIRAILRQVEVTPEEWNNL